LAEVVCDRSIEGRVSIVRFEETSGSAIDDAAQELSLLVGDGVARLSPELHVFSASPRKQWLGEIVQPSSPTRNGKEGWVIKVLTNWSARRYGYN
jgi:hypothetical protein